VNSLLYYLTNDSLDILTNSSQLTNKLAYYSTVGIFWIYYLVILLASSCVASGLSPLHVGLWPLRPEMTSFYAQMFGLRPESHATSLAPSAFLHESSFISPIFHVRLALDSSIHSSPRTPSPFAHCSISCTSIILRFHPPCTLFMFISNVALSFASTTFILCNRQHDLAANSNTEQDPERVWCSA
jgi:hypothetical protein